MCFVLKTYTDISAETLIFGVREVCANACLWDLDVTGPWMNMWGSFPKTDIQRQIILYILSWGSRFGVSDPVPFSRRLPRSNLENGLWPSGIQRVVVWENQRRNTEKDCLGSEVSYGLVEFLRAPEGLESLVAQNADC